MTVADVEVSTPLVSEAGKATAYFEDLLFQMISEINTLTTSLTALEARVTALEVFHP